MNPDITIVAPQGRLDAALARPLEAELKEHLAAGRINLLLDFSSVRYISSVGLRLLLTTMRQAHARGGSLKVCCLDLRVMEIFTMAGFDRVLSVVATREEAEKSFTHAR